MTFRETIEQAYDQGPEAVEAAIRVYYVVIPRSAIKEVGEPESDSGDDTH